MKLQDPYDDRDPAECPHCGALMEAEPDCDIDTETGVASVCGVVAWCPNLDCREGRDE